MIGEAILQLLNITPRRKHVGIERMHAAAIAGYLHGQDCELHELEIATNEHHESWAWERAMLRNHVDDSIAPAALGTTQGPVCWEFMNALYLEPYEKKAPTRAEELLMTFPYPVTFQKWPFTKGLHEVASCCTKSIIMRPMVYVYFVLVLQF
jgi:hypothetical protein